MGELSGRRPDDKVEMIIKPLIRDLREFSEVEIDDDATYRPSDVRKLVRDLHQPLARIIESIPLTRQARANEMPGVPRGLLGDAALPVRPPHRRAKASPKVHYIDAPCENELGRGARLLAATVESRQGALRLRTYNLTDVAYGLANPKVMKRSEVGWDEDDALSTSRRGQGASIYVRHGNEALVRPAVDRDVFVTAANDDRQKRFVATLKNLTGYLLDVAEGKEGKKDDHA